MPPKLTVSQNVINRLRNVKEKCTGNLYGILYKNTLLIIGFNVHNEEKTDILNEFPTGIDLYGVFEIAGEISEQEKVKLITGDVDVTDTPLYMLLKNDTTPNNIETFFNVNNRLEKANFEVISEQDIYSQFVHIHLVAQLPLISDVSAECVKENFASLHKQLVNGQVVFNIPKSNIYIMGNEYENGLVGLSGDPIVGEVCKKSTGVSEGCPPSNKKKKNEVIEMDFLRMTMLKKVTSDPALDSGKIHAPILHVEKRKRNIFKLTLNVDTLILVHKNEKIIGLYSLLLESCCRFLKLLEGIVINNVDSCVDYAQISQPESFHFFPEQCGHFITRIYVANQTEGYMAKARRLLHKQLLLPLNQPLFRKANRFVFKGDVQGGGILINPHEGLNPVKTEGEVALVKGKYRYYHYCQDKMDDSGWGCAYRSLQTLASWFLLQGFTDRDVPSFDDIQKSLINIGDKPPSFLGSKQWIGSTEVNFVLSSLLNITSKIIYVSSGEDMVTKGPELVYHFKTHGSPIMIGGGVLAHTILGVDYNNLTGDIKFLILDPHYTGSEDLDFILKKGWCGWKGVKFWDKTAYYNMCLPQVPVCV